MANFTFIGFSTLAPMSSRRSWVLTDVELIKRDLLNHFYTRRGERIGRPEFGSILFELVMEPNLEYVHDQIDAEVRRVIDLDSRLGLRKLLLKKGKNTVYIECDVDLIPFKTVEKFILEFDIRQETI